MPRSYDTEPRDDARRARTRRDARLLLVAAAGLGTGCPPEKHMSPWGARGTPDLAYFVEQPDLERHVASMLTETGAGGLVERAAVKARAGDGTLYDVRSFEGRDRLGRRTTAVRVASPHGVVLAVGPLSEVDPRSRPTELVASIGAWRGGSLALPLDLTGDGTPEIALRSERGDLTIYTLLPHGAAAVPIDLAGTPTDLAKLTKTFGLVARRRFDSGPITASYARIATYQAKRFTEDAGEARAWHRDQAAARSVIPAEEAPPARLSRLLERAFHRALAATEPESREEAVATLERERAPAELEPSFREAIGDLRAALGEAR